MLTAQKEKNVLDGRIKVEDLLIIDGGPHSKATRASHLPKPKFLSFFQVNIHLGPRSCQMWHGKLGKGEQGGSWSKGQADMVDFTAPCTPLGVWRLLGSRWWQSGEPDRHCVWKHGAQSTEQAEPVCWRPKPHKLVDLTVISMLLSEVMSSWRAPIPPSPPPLQSCLGTNWPLATVGTRSTGASRCSKLSRELNSRLLFVCVWPTKDRPFYYKWKHLPLMAGSTTVRGLRSWDHPVSDGSQGTSFQHPGQLLTHSEPSRRIRVRNEILGTTLVVQKLGTPNCIVWGTCLIPGLRTKILHATWWSQKIYKKRTLFNKKTKGAVSGWREAEKSRNGLSTVVSRFKIP